MTTSLNLLRSGPIGFRLAIATKLRISCGSKYREWRARRAEVGRRLALRFGPVETSRGFAAVSFAADELESESMTFDEMRPGAYEVKSRLEDMDLDGVEASICFPNAFVRFCGQRFSGGARQGSGPRLRGRPTTTG